MSQNRNSEKGSVNANQNDKMTKNQKNSATQGIQSDSKKK